MKQRVIKNLPFATCIALGKYSVKDFYVLSFTDDYKAVWLGRRHPDGKIYRCFLIESSRRVWL